MSSDVSDMLITLCVSKTKKCNIDNGIVNFEEYYVLKQVDHEDAVFVAA